jgi:glycosyltransferase involved in cell wall biosynthesis
MSPLTSVIVPVYNRTTLLRRALLSLARQTLDDFECLVVDDASTDPIQQVVDDFDDRFRYIRRESNGGCTAARFTALEHVRGEFLTGLDSDNVLFPWTLERGGHYLRTYREVDAAIGLFVFPDGLRLRVAEEAKILSPAEFARRDTPASVGVDAVPIYRSSLREEWLRLRRDYFNLDLVFAICLHRSHSVVMVDEPWGRYDPSGADRLTATPDRRELEDVAKFIDDFRPLVGTSPCGPVDIYLIQTWQRLVRARRYRDAAAVADWLRERGVSRSEAVRRKLSWVLQRTLTESLPRPMHVF